MRRPLLGSCLVSLWMLTSCICLLSFLSLIHCDSIHKRMNASKISILCSAGILFIQGNFLGYVV
jgi:hypothetical protein